MHLNMPLGYNNSLFITGVGQDFRPETMGSRGLYVSLATIVAFHVLSMSRYVLHLLRETYPSKIVSQILYGSRSD